MYQLASRCRSLDSLSALFPAFAVLLLSAQAVAQSDGRIESLTISYIDAEFQISGAAPALLLDFYIGLTNAGATDYQSGTVTGPGMDSLPLVRNQDPCSGDFVACVRANSGNAPKPSFEPPGVYTFDLTFDDGSGGLETDSFSVVFDPLAVPTPARPIFLVPTFGSVVAPDGLILVWELPPGSAPPDEYDVGVTSEDGFSREQIGPTATDWPVPASLVPSADQIAAIAAKNFAPLNDLLTTTGGDSFSYQGQNGRSLLVSFSTSARAVPIPTAATSLLGLFLCAAGSWSLAPGRKRGKGD